MLSAIIKGMKSRVLLISHINLLLPAYVIKLFTPKTKTVLIAHGIEVWKPLSKAKKKMLKRMDYILPVSDFTKQQMQQTFQLPAEKFSTLNNCLDPFLPGPSSDVNKMTWRKKYGLSENDLVLMTLTRLSATEKNKCYDKVLVALKNLQSEYPQLKYVFVGKYDLEEKKRLETLSNDLGILAAITFTGFVEDNEIAEYYNMADVYIMPSEKEGFGISFIEAMFYNIPVIAGNRDGSIDALANGELGTLIDPRSQDEITAAIQKVLENKKAFTPNRELLLNKFSYPVYKNNLQKILNLNLQP